jgi:D-arabinose 1-dehydrogenase-like Zn-dependent alcohol dehydrogenase
MLVPHLRYLFDIGDLPPERVAPLACSGVTTFGALHQKMGGHSAMVVDVDPAKRKAAKEAGAGHVIDGGASDAAQQIIDLTEGGAWAMIDLVGSSQSARVGYDSLIKGANTSSSACSAAT